MKTEKGHTPKRIELLWIEFLDPKVDYHVFRKPLKKILIPTIARFKPKEIE
jgi:hypothetical protein